MFTGCIRHIGTVAKNVAANGPFELIVCTGLAESAVPGDSIAVNGACLTVTSADIVAGTVAFDLLAETIKRTTLGKAGKEDSVNLERPLRVGDPLDGHMVTGHVDCIGTAVAADQSLEDYRLVVRVPNDARALIIDKGSITIDGVSLTIASVDDDFFSVHLIPYTLRHTNLNSIRTGDSVNLELDWVGKYVQRSQFLSSSTGTLDE